MTVSWNLNSILFECTSYNFNCYYHFASIFFSLMYKYLVSISLLFNSSSEWVKGSSFSLVFEFCCNPHCTMTKILRKVLIHDVLNITLIGAIVVMWFASWVLSKSQWSRFDPISCKWLKNNSQSGHELRITRESQNKSHFGHLFDWDTSEHLCQHSGVTSAGCAIIVLKGYANCQHLI